jgi:nucleoside-diphosphate-sugar epimerase
MILLLGHFFIASEPAFQRNPGQKPHWVKYQGRLTTLIRYGQTKLEGEQAVLEISSRTNSKNKVVVLRVPVLYGSCDEPKDSAVNVLMSQLWNAQQIEQGQPKIQVDDYALRYPTNTQDVGRVCREIAKLYLDPASA